MKKYGKRAAAFLTAIILAFTMTACGGGQKVNAKEKGSVASEFKARENSGGSADSGSGNDTKPLTKTESGTDNPNSEIDEGAVIQEMETPSDDTITVGGGIRSEEDTSETTSEKYEVTTAEVPVYAHMKRAIGTMDVYFVDGNEEIPYISDDMIPVLMDVVSDICGRSVDYSFYREDNYALYTNYEGYSCLIDFGEDWIYFDDYNAFFRSENDGSILDVTTPVLDDDGNPLYMASTDYCFERYGRRISIDLADYLIDLVCTDEYNLIPLQTFADVFLMNLAVPVLYNENGVFLNIYGGDMNYTPAGEEYYNAESGPRSRELAEFSYRELCLALDMHYGLKERHNIYTFDELFQETGLDVGLKSRDGKEVSDAINELVNGYLGDLHSGYLSASSYAGSDVEVTYRNLSSTLYQEMFTDTLYTGARYLNYPDGIPFYEEFGNTAYITLDDFTYDMFIDYYNDGMPEDPADWDTRGMIIAANEYIHREDSPVENIVLDLSLNGGGTVDSAAFVISWFLGNCTFNIEDTFTGAQVSQTYLADVNLDGSFDENDSVMEYNLYCLISPYSFSCGNLVPCTFKNAGTVTLLGSHSGGGACTVQPIALADGTCFQISGPRRISTVTNGSFYDVDQGVDADFHIDKIDNYYDRENLTEYINSLY